LALVLGKGFIATLSALAMRFPARVAWLAGVSLAQFSEFGFVLTKLGETLGLVGSAETHSLLTAGVLSMFFTPVAVRIAPHFTAGEKLLRPLERLLGARGMDEPAPEHSSLTNHIVVVGYGIAGRLLTRALAERKISYVVLELNSETVRAARGAGEPVYYGDITSPEVLAHAQVQHARALVLMINDSQAVRRAVAAARRFAPQTPVLVRTRYIADLSTLSELGVDDTVVEELEAGMEMMARVLRRLGLPRNLIDENVRYARGTTQSSERKRTFPRLRLGEIPDLAQLKIESVVVREGAFACGKSTIALDLRSRTGALIVAIRRGGILLGDPDPMDLLHVGDVLFFVGSGDSIRSAIRLLEEGEPKLSPT
jgi:monovalent cation:H+ antiporter-2, CPA2 family